MSIEQKRQGYVFDGSFSFLLTSAAKCIKKGYLLPELPRLGLTSKAVNGLRVEVQNKNPYPRYQKNSDRAGRGLKEPQVQNLQPL
jgi:hypothetical protein